MKFDLAIQALGTTTWDWSERGFAALLAELGLTREADADPAMPNYESPWGNEWVQAIIEDGAVERLEVLVEDTSPRWRPFTTKKLEALGRKYRDKLAAYVKRAEAVLGAPTFYGDAGTPGSPDDEDGYVLALWRRDTARLMLIARNEGPDTPYWISIVIKPLTARAPTARASRPVMRAPTRQSSVALNGARFDTALDKIASVRWDWSTPSDEILEKLALPAKRDGDRIELAVESRSPPSGGFSDDDHEDLSNEYLEKYDLYVQRAQRILGKPKFNDGMATKGYPQDEPGEHAAVWQLKTARVMLVFRSGPPEGDAPYSLSIVIRPR
jgi:hypothetical protein